jgi:uracil-DNA glycosylase family 4
VLFIGEGPGVSEDLLSIPFIGPAGKVLDSIITKAWELANVDTTYALYNIVSCVPKDEHGKKIHTPKEEAIIACSPKVKEFIELCSPSLIVCVGSIATTWILGTTKRTEKFALQDFKGTVLSIVHPAAILRMNISQRPLEIQKCVVAIVDSLEDL